MPPTKHRGRGLGISFASVLPRLPRTDLGFQGRCGLRRATGCRFDAFVASSGPVLTPEQVGRSVRGIVDRRDSGAYLLTSAGLSPVARYGEQGEGRSNMNTPPIVSAQEWAAAHQQLLVKEKEVTPGPRRAGGVASPDAVAAVDKDYEFEGPDGKWTCWACFRVGAS